MKKSNKAKTCILHIGMHKTGSSSIQRFLNDNNDKLGDGVIYANMGPENHSGPFLYALTENPYECKNIKRKYLSDTEIKANIDKYRGNLIKSLQQNYQTIIFSAEGAGRLSEAELLSFKHLLLQYVDEIKVFAYVRPPFSYMESALQQRCKASIVDTKFRGLYPKYRKRFKQFEQVFDDVQYKLFSRKELYQGDVIKDFCQQFSLVYTNTNNVNESLSLLAVKFLYHFQRNRKTDKIRHKNTRLLEKELANLRSEKLRLSQEVITWTLNKYSGDLRWMKTRVPNLLSENEVASPRPVRDIDWESINEDEYSQLMHLTKSEVLSEFIAEECGMTLSELVKRSFQITAI